MDGRVAAIRAALDDEGFADTPSWPTRKFASAFYGPFREAAESAPGVRRPPDLPDGPGQRARGGARGELDIEEGADIVMVKPALPYLDVIRAVSRRRSSRWPPTTSAASTR